MKIILLISIFFNILLFSLEDTEASFSYIQLENKNYSFDEILQKERNKLFSTLQQNQSKFGFTQDIFWIKAYKKNTSAVEKNYTLELKHPSLDYIDIYELKNKNLLLKKELGDLRVYDKSTFMPNPNYEFKLLPQQEKIFFIKIKSEGTLNIGISIQDVNSYNLYSSTHIKWLSFYFGAVFIMLMYNFIIYIIIKNKSFLYYVLFHLSYSLFALTLSGISFEILWPQTPQINLYVLPISMALTGGFGLLFAIHFLDLYKMKGKLTKFLYSLSIISFSFSILPFITNYSVSIQLTSIISFFITIALFIISLYLILMKKNINVFFYLIAWSFFLLGVVIAHLSNIGIIPSTMLTSFSSQIGSFFELLLLSIGLAYYYNRLKDEHRELTYKNNKLWALSHQDPLTGSYNRRYFHDKVNTLLCIAKEDKSSFYLLALDLDFFKKINDTYGHDIGDQVLISFAAKCMSKISTNDVFARFGGEEFVLFLAKADEERAIKIAKDINDTIRNSIFDFAPDLMLTVSIGLSHSSFELKTLLLKADKALYRVKEQGRDSYSIYN